MNPASLASKAIKAELKATLPKIEFSVTSQSYTGGNRVSIEYTDAVPIEVVEAIVSKYRMGDSNTIDDSYQYNNRRDDIPQVRNLFIHRRMSESAKLGIAGDMGIAFDQIESYNDIKEEFNLVLIRQEFNTRTYGHYGLLLEAMGASDDEPTAVLIKDGKEVDLVTELFDNGNAREIQVPETIGEDFKSPVFSDSPLYGFDRLVHHFHASGMYASLRGEPKPIAVAEYPNEVSFDKVYKDYPGGQILRVTEAFGGPGDWFPISNFFKENEIEFWTPAEMIQRLIDRDGATKFTLEIEDEYGRIKNPDYSKNDLVPNREN